MFDFSEATINKLIVHQVGNKLKEEKLTLSDEEATVKESELDNILQRYFFQSFKDTDTYSFCHEVDLKYNEVYGFISQIFADPNSFILNSQNIAKHLYEVSTHPNLRCGELYVTYLIKVQFGTTYCDAIGIFKSESKEHYLKVTSVNRCIIPEWDTGTNPNKLDKGCIIFNLNKEFGYKAIIIDSKNSIEAKYWVHDFLNMKKTDSTYYKTKIIADACKQFVKTDFKGDASERAVALNNVLHYITSNESMNLDDFTSEMLDSMPRMDGMKEFIEDYADKKEISNIKSFPLNSGAVKGIKKSIKNLIKLDTKIEIRLTTSYTEGKQFIERGFDSVRQMYFYKVYFYEEK